MARQAIDTALEKLFDALTAGQEQSSDRVAKLEREIRELKEYISESRPIIVPISVLDPEPYELTREISVVVQPHDDSYVATFFDANINASGETQQTAVANLKDMMVGIYERLQKEPKAKLGKWPTRQ